MAMVCDEKCVRIHIDLQRLGFNVINSKEKTIEFLNMNRNAVYIFYRDWCINFVINFSYLRIKCQATVKICLRVRRSWKLGS